MVRLRQISFLAVYAILWNFPYNSFLIIQIFTYHHVSYSCIAVFSLLRATGSLNSQFQTKGWQLEESGRSTHHFLYLLAKLTIVKYSILNMGRLSEIEVIGCSNLLIWDVIRFFDLNIIAFHLVQNSRTSVRNSYYITRTYVCQ